VHSIICPLHSKPQHYSTANYWCALPTVQTRRDWSKKKKDGEKGRFNVWSEGPLLSKNDLSLLRITPSTKRVSDDAVCHRTVSGNKLT
jgi:outer membrane receptor for ferrienterochelin and colicin